MPVFLPAVALAAALSSTEPVQQMAAPPAKAAASALPVSMTMTRPPKAT